MLLDDTGPRLGLPTLQAYCSGVSRSVLEYLLSGYRQKFQEEHRLVVETLSWLRDGAVWAIDHSQPPCVIEGAYTQILAIRDLEILRVGRDSSWQRHAARLDACR